MNLISVKNNWIVIFSLLFILFILINLLSPSKSRKVFIDGDGKGHYAYLPSIFIYHSVDFSQLNEFEKTTRPVDYINHTFHSVNGVLINKFTVGTALLQLPFFLFALFLSPLFGFLPDGYSPMFQYSVALAALFWAAVGLIFIIKTASTFGIPVKYSILISLSGILGTNLFFYTFFAPSFSHVYSFSAVSLFIFFCRKTLVDFSYKYLYLSAFLFGIILVIRPVNFVAIFLIPVLSPDWQTLKTVLLNKTQFRPFIFSILFFLTAVSPQIIINVLQTGQPIVYGYQHEGFYFFNPEIINFLFSYRKGWFIYTPFLLLLLPSLISLWRISRFRFWSFICFFVLTIYLFSSWWNWIYGDSFGMRPMVDFYAIFFLVICSGIFIVKNKFKRIILSSFIALSIILNLIQTYQYASRIIHPDSMNAKAYWYVFLKTGEKYKDIIAGQDEYFYGSLNEAPFYRTFNTIDSVSDNWSGAQLIKTEESTSNQFAVLNSETQFSPTFTYQIPPDLIGSKNLYVIFETKFMEPYPDAALFGLFTVDLLNDSGKTVFYKTFRLKKLPDDKTESWRDGSIGFKLPEFSSDFKQIKFYIWNAHKQTFYVDNIGLGLFTYQD